MHKAVRDLLIRLYPRAWRQRYGSEFEALLEDSGGGPKVFFDVLKELISMRLQSKDFRYLAAFSLAGLLIAGGASLRIPNRYRSSAVAEVRVAPGADPVEEVSRATTALVSSKDAIAGNILVNVKSRRKSPDTIVFQVSFAAPDPAEANRTTRRLTASLTTALEARSGVVRLLDPASLPTTPLSPNRAVIMLAGLFGGFLPAFLLILLRRSPTPKQPPPHGSALAN